MQCPSCGNNGMLFDSHSGLEHNVCEKCGTVVEYNPFVVDIFQVGSREVSCNYNSKPKPYERGMVTNPKSKTFTESRDILTNLMDRLSLPIETREFAMYILRFTKFLDNRCCAGACVYLAMKRHDIPITIKYIANYLQVSHFTVGKVMKVLERRLGSLAQCNNVFSADRLALLIFSQAKFGGTDGGKKRLELLLRKTEQLLQLLQESQIAINYQPHIIILAAGYIVWRNVIGYGWGEMKDKLNGNFLDNSYSKRSTVKSYLSEVGIQLSTFNTLYEKINFITGLLYKFARGIPWICDKIQSKAMIYFHLDDFIKYKSQIVALATQDVPKESIIKMEDLNVEEEECSSKSSGDIENSVSANCEAGKANHGVEEDISSTIPGSSEEGKTQKYNCSIDFDSDLGYASIVLKDKSSIDERRNDPVYRKINYTKLTDLRHIGANLARIKKVHDNETDKNGEEKSVIIVSPTEAWKYDSLASLSFP